MLSIAVILPLLDNGTLLAAEELARTIADAKPWETYVVKRNRSNLLLFGASGSGTLSDGVASINATWRSAPGGICIKAASAPEKCLQLTRTKIGIAGIQSGSVVWILKR